MENTIVAAALLVVIFLLAMVVYDTNPALRKLFGRDIGKASHKKNQLSDEEELAELMDEAGLSDHEMPGLSADEAETIDQEIAAVSFDEAATPDQKKKPKGMVGRLRGIISRKNTPGDDESLAVDEEERPQGIAKRLRGIMRLKKSNSDSEAGEETRTPLDMIEGEIDELELLRDELGKQRKPLAHARQVTSLPVKLLKRVPGLLRRGKTPDTDQEDMANTLRDAVNDLTNRLAQSEAALERIWQLEEGLSKVSEDTEIISEDMKDVIGSLRVSIDGLESRINQIGSEKEGERDTEPEDGETREKVKQLEEMVANMNSVVESLPQEMQANKESVKEFSTRLDGLSTDIRRTLGYGIQRTFKCDSCGSEGLVATQVVCSSCGTGSMWGWWPTTQEPVDQVAKEDGDAKVEFETSEPESAV